jgi:hypothetical protein
MCRSDSPPPPAPRPDACGSRYRVDVLPDAEPTAQGLAYERGGSSRVLTWGRVVRALAAEVGEPQGVRTIVFDLVVGREGPDWVAYRFNTDPGGDAVAVARAIQRALGDRAAPSIKSVAEDGTPTRWYPDLQSFEEAVLRALGGA